MGRPTGEATPKHVLILEAARELFLTEGYGAVTMDRLATSAKVSKATLYTRFASKEAMFAAVLKLLWTGLIVNLEDPETLIGPPKDALSAFGTKLLRLFSTPRALATFRLWAGEADRIPGLAGKFEARMMEPFHRALASYLRQESARGTLAIQNPRLAAAQFLGLILQPTFWPYVLGLRSVVFRPRDTVAAACQTFLAAYAPRRRQG
jgi:TetR/AcrR family transcriptional regulator of autoinduction and epiphytic fitness